MKLVTDPSCLVWKPGFSSLFHADFFDSTCKNPVMGGSMILKEGLEEFLLFTWLNVLFRRSKVLNLLFRRSKLCPFYSKQCCNGTAFLFFANSATSHIILKWFYPSLRKYLVSPERLRYYSITSNLLSVSYMPYTVLSSSQIWTSFSALNPTWGT